MFKRGEYDIDGERSHGFDGDESSQGRAQSLFAAGLAYERAGKRFVPSVQSWQADLLHGAGPQHRAHIPSRALLSARTARNAGSLPNARR